MKKAFIFIFCFSSALNLLAQNDSTMATEVSYVHKDPRLDILAKKEADLNAYAAKLAARSSMGYRLQVMSTNDRNLAMKTKAQLLEKFPEQKVYIFYKLPYIKIRFGNFKTQDEAEKYKKQISRMLDGASIYFVSERIEVKPDKELKNDEDD